MSAFALYVILSFVVAAVCLAVIYGTIAVILRVSETRLVRRVGPAPERETPNGE